MHLRSTSSTNDRARELALAGAPHGTLVTAEEQTAGRGRQGRTWSAPRGRALLASLLVRWEGPENAPTLLPLIAAVAVCDVAGDEVQIKWPNDVVIAQTVQTRGVDAIAPLAKLAGILIESRLQECWAIVGIGVNVAVELQQLPDELQPGGSRPAATLGYPPEQVEPTLKLLLAALEHRLAEPAEATLAAWRARDALCGREIAWGAAPEASGRADSEGSIRRGRADGIDGSGRLVVALPEGGRLTLGAGEVHLGEVR